MSDIIGRYLVAELAMLIVDCRAATSVNLASYIRPRIDYIKLKDFFVENIRILLFISISANISIRDSVNIKFLNFCGLFKFLSLIFRPYSSMMYSFGRSNKNMKRKKKHMILFRLQKHDNVIIVMYNVNSSH